MESASASQVCLSKPLSRRSALRSTMPSDPTRSSASLCRSACWSLNTHFPTLRSHGRGISRVLTCCSASDATSGPQQSARRGIVAENLSLWWPDGTPALRDVSFHVPPGTLAMVAGSNGSGKSTLLSALRGIRLPDLGSVHVDPPCGFVYQSPLRQLFLPSVAVNLAVSVPETNRSHPGHATLDNEELRERALDGLERLGFVPPEPWMGKRARQLSGGEGQRVAIAAALLMQPKSILFDEVTASMDTSNRNLLLDIMPSIIKDEKIAALWVTHTREELASADMIILMDRGTVVAKGSPSEVLPLIDQKASGRSYFD